MKINVNTVKRKLQDLNSLYKKIGDKDHDEDYWFKKSKEVHERLKQFEEDVFIRACDLWCREEHGRMPSIADLEKRCNRIAQDKKKEKVNISNLNELVCNHVTFFTGKGFDQTNDEIAICHFPSLERVKSLIDFHGERELKNLHTNALMSKRDYGDVLCPWHQDLYRAKRNPNSSTAQYCKDFVEHHKRYDNKSVEEIQKETLARLKALDFKKF